MLARTWSLLGFTTPSMVRSLEDTVLEVSKALYSQCCYLVCENDAGPSNRLWLLLQA